MNTMTISAGLLTDRLTVKGMPEILAKSQQVVDIKHKYTNMGSELSRDVLLREKGFTRVKLKNQRKL